MKKITLSLLLFISVILSTYAQVEIGTGTNVQQRTPFYAPYGLSYAQSIYLNSEINATGTITSIQWYFNGNSLLDNSQQLVIYLGNTTKSKFSSDTDWVPLTDLTKVYEGGITTTLSPGWVTINLTTPFTYNGTSNLVIAVDENQPKWDNDAYFYNSEVVGIRSMCYYNDVVNSDPAAPEQANWQNNFVPNIIFGGINQSCPNPKQLKATNITTNSATVSWTAPTSAPTGGIDIYVSSSNISPTESTTPTAHINSGNSYDVNSLTPATIYYVYARNICATTDISSWSDPAIFITECASISAFNENFDFVTTPSLPACWSTIFRGSTVDPYAEIKTQDYIYKSPSNAVQMYNGSSNTGVDDDMILVAPKLDQIKTTYRLKLYAANGKYDGSIGKIEIGTLNNATATADFTPYQVLGLDKTLKQYIVNFDAYTGTDTYIGIRMKTEGNYQNVYLDNIVWEPAPTCPDVILVSASAITQTSATISWDNNNAPSWQVAVGPITADPNTLPHDTSTNPNISIGGLTTNTQYNVWVRSVCDNGNDIGAWSDPTTFMTECDAIAAFNQTFDTSETTVPNLPNCWSKILRGSGLTDYAKIETIDANYAQVKSPPNSVVIDNSGTYTAGETNDIILVTPKLSNLGNSTYRLTLYARTDENDSKLASFQIGTLDNNTNSAIFTPIQTISPTKKSTQYKIDFSNYTGNNTYIGIRMSSSQDYSKAYLDNIVWEQNPTCPDVTNINAKDITDTSATIYWTKEDQTKWDVAVGPLSATDPETLDQTTTTNPFLDLTNLAVSTSYNVWVRTVCTSETGNWEGPFTFTTDCSPIAVFNENFDTAATVVPNLPSCWSKIIRGASVSEYAYIVTATYPQLSSLPNNVEMNNSNSEPTDDIILVSPNLSSLANLSNVNYRLKFYAKKPSYVPNGNLEIGTLSNNSNTAVFTSVQEIVTTDNLKQFVVVFNTSTSDKYIGIRMKSPDKFTTVNLDNILWEISPVCPDVTEITVPDVTTTTATIKWTKGGDENTWDVAVGPVGSDVNTLTFSPSDSTTFVAENLNTNTKYEVWVRSVCVVGGNGAWIGPILFSTACNSVETIDENFDEVTTPNLPSCWSKIIRGNTVSQTAFIKTSTYPSVYSSPNSVDIYLDNSSTSDEIILVTPSISTLNDPTYKLSFYTKGFGVGSVQIGTLSSNTSSATFNVIKTVTLTNNTLEQWIVDLNSYSGPDTYIGLRATDNDYYAEIGFDNVVWQKSLSTNQFDGSKFSYYPNPVKDVLNISYINNITAVSVYNLLGQEVITKSVNDNLTKVDMSALSKGTYMVKVTADNLVKTIKVIKQ